MSQGNSRRKLKKEIKCFRNGVALRAVMVFIGVLHWAFVNTEMYLKLEKSYDQPSFGQAEVDDGWCVLKYMLVVAVNISLITGALLCWWIPILFWLFTYGGLSIAIAYKLRNLAGFLFSMEYLGGGVESVLRVFDSNSRHWRLEDILYLGIIFLSLLIVSACFVSLYACKIDNHRPKQKKVVGEQPEAEEDDAWIYHHHHGMHFAHTVILHDENMNSNEKNLISVQRLLRMQMDKLPTYEEVQQNDSPPPTYNQLVL